jgi:lipid-A-disaccharide synthase
VNLIAGREVVPELVADTFSVEALKRELARIMPGGEGREPMLRGYEEVRQRLGSQCAPDEAASLMIKLLKK